jgi:hypothetical protein
MKLDTPLGGMIAAYVALVKALILSGSLDREHFLQSVLAAEAALKAGGVAKAVEAFDHIAAAALQEVGFHPPAQPKLT